MKEINFIKPTVTAQGLPAKTWLILSALVLIAGLSLLGYHQLKALHKLAKVRDAYDNISPRVVHIQEMERELARLRTQKEELSKDIERLEKKLNVDDTTLSLIELLATKLPRGISFDKITTNTLTTQLEGQVNLRHQENLQSLLDMLQYAAWISKARLEILPSSSETHLTFIITLYHKAHQGRYGGN